MAHVDQYHLDLSRISLADLFETFREGHIAPGRRILLDERAARRGALEMAGISSLADLVAALKTKSRLASLAEATGLSQPYLTILARQARSYLPSPVALDRLMARDTPIVAVLSAHGIGTSRHLFDAVAEAESVSALADAVGIAPDDHPSRTALADLVGLSDLVRVPGVGPVFAQFFLDIGIRSVPDLAGSQPEDIYHRVNRHAAAVGYTGPTATEWDLQFCVSFAAALSSAAGS